MLRRKLLFRERGAGAADEIRAANARIRDLKAQAAADFPLSESALPGFFEALCAQIQAVSAAEHQAVQSLQTAVP
jgi:hypothetical protein